MMLTKNINNNDNIEASTAASSSTRPLTQATMRMLFANSTFFSRKIFRFYLDIFISSFLCLVITQAAIYLSWSKIHHS